MTPSTPVRQGSGLHRFLVSFGGGFVGSLFGCLFALVVLPMFLGWRSDAGAFMIVAHSSDESLSRDWATGTLVVTLDGGQPADAWVPCDGREIDVARYSKLHSLLRDRVGGAGQVFAPDYRGMFFPGSFRGGTWANGNVDPRVFDGSSIEAKFYIRGR